LFYVEIDAVNRSILRHLLSGWSDCFPAPVIDALQQRINALSAETTIQSSSSSSSSNRVGGLLESLLPPRPTAEPDSAVVERVALYLRKSADGLDFNAHLRSLKSFRNPSILEKLVSKFDIDEHGSRCEPSVWNPHQLDNIDRYDVLAKRAKQTEVERSSATTGRVEFVAASTTSDAAAKKPSAPLSEHAKKLVKKEKFRQKAIKQRENAAAAQARAIDNQKKRTWF
jgi:hypothetical protein